MKITRTINGKTNETELTSEELKRAHREHECNNIKNNKEFYFGNFNSDEYKLLADNEDFINDVVEEAHSQMIYGNVSFGTAIYRAIKKLKDEYMTEGCY